MPAQQYVHPMRLYLALRSRGQTEWPRHHQRHIIIIALPLHSRLACVAVVNTQQPSGMPRPTTANCVIYSYKERFVGPALNPHTHTLTALHCTCALRSKCGCCHKAWRKCRRAQEDYASKLNSSDNTANTSHQEAHTTDIQHKSMTIFYLFICHIRPSTATFSTFVCTSHVTHLCFISRFYISIM